ncbi:MAG: RND family transporter [Deltaproteobacteria bacterium]|nr:RND family transporter [Deltaproteobacteria bacterium]
MTKLQSLLTLFYDKFILEWPGLVIVCILAVVLFFGYRAKDFRLDASAETLVLENDDDLRYSRLINSRYGESDYLVIAYTPKGDLFSVEALTKLRRLRDDLIKLKRVSSVISILDVPLLESPPVPVKELATNIQTLESPTIDMKLARVEFSNSPLYRNLLVSPDLKTTALQVKFFTDEVYHNLLKRRNSFREKETAGQLTPDEAAEFKEVSDQFQKHRDRMRAVRHQDIAAIRTIIDSYSQDAEVFLGGVSMIADDLIVFIKNDLKIFGLGVLFFLVVTLKLIFKKMRWIVLPVLCCASSAVSMMGLLGIFGWEVTVVSSNFISLQLIITMAITIHLIVRYRELHSRNPETEHRKNILDAVRLMMRPCLYAALTTMAGFGSLVLCDILPVITFGWMMIAGITVSLILTFLLFPAALMLLNKGALPQQKDTRFSLTSILARFTETHGMMIMIISCVAFVISAIGISRLEVENSFIDYFKDTTEIYQGMKVIDQKLGGTTPLDVILDLDKPELSIPLVASESDTEIDDEFDEFDEFDEAQGDEKYWFTSDKMAKVVRIHDYLDKLPETGKVLSLGTIMKIAEKLNNGRPLDNFKLALLYSELPEKIKKNMVAPFVSVEHNQVRFSVRVRDSEKSLKRNELLKKIRKDLNTKLGVKEDHVRLTGMLVLYNNMLQSLFSSQLLTLGAVVLALMCMFMILFRSLNIALIAIFPNLMSIAVVLGFMGWMNIPLDMMTITIAAISIGIAVDNTIHYIHRFRHEFETDNDYIKTVYRCHGSIGYAMYYTSLTIIMGFSILVLSNFIPSIYFGLLTGLAMLIALIASLTLLPQLLIFFKPFGPQSFINGE